MSSFSPNKEKVQIDFAAVVAVDVVVNDIYYGVLCVPRGAELEQRQQQAQVDRAFVVWKIFFPF